MKFLVCLAALFLTGCAFGVAGSGKLETRDLPLGEFEAVEAGGSFSVDVTQGSATSVVVTADDNLWEYLNIHNDGGTLHLEMRPGSYRDAHLSAKVVTPRLRRLELSGASNGTMRGIDLPQGHFELEVSGASTLLNGDLRAGEANVNLSGASSAILQGRVDELKVDVSGASHAALEDFPTKNADVQLTRIFHAVVAAGYSATALPLVDSGVTTLLNHCKEARPCRQTVTSRPFVLHRLDDAKCWAASMAARSVPMAEPFFCDRSIAASDCWNASIS